MSHKVRRSSIERDRDVTRDAGDVEKVLQSALVLCGHAEAAAVWYLSPINELDDLTPAALVRQGRSGEVLDWISRRKKRLADSAALGK